VSPTPRAVVLLALAALSGLRLPWQVAGTIMLGVAVVSLVDSWLVRRVPELTRTTSPILSRGVPSRIEIGAVGRWPRIRLRQAATPDIRITPQEGERTLDAEIVALRRGTHPLVPVATRTTGPLGLGSWYHRSGPTGQVTVFPDMPAARRIATSVRMGHFREEGRRTRGPLGLGTEFESVREYRPDDDIRQLNWTATARTGSPMSNQFRIEQDRDLICLVDCGRLMAARVEDRTRLDAAVDAVAALAAVADQVGDRIGVVAFDRKVLRSLAPRRDGGRAVVQAIHDLEPSEADSDFDLAIRSVLGRKRAFVVVFTDLVDIAAARPLSAAIPVLARKHAVAVVSVTDPDLMAGLVEPAADRAGLMRSAASVQLIEAKESVTALLRHRGVDVVDAGLHELSSRCVAAYLRAKARARL
jgi:uncharacterized protein (DUF58 family)